MASKRAWPITSGGQKHDQEAAVQLVFCLLMSLMWGEGEEEGEEEEGEEGEEKEREEEGGEGGRRGEEEEEGESI